MGANQSSGKVVSVSNETSQHNEIVAGQFGVTISGPVVEKGFKYNGDIKKDIQTAFEKGKEEGLSTVENTLSIVAQQTFENIHAQLTDINRSSVEESKALVCITDTSK